MLGIETTNCLLEVILMNDGHGYEFALSAAISRFLNLITHAGMNMCNLSRYYDVAKYFKIPKRIVDIRHDINHGQMPSKSQLESAVSFCFKWILKNYWEYEHSHQLKCEDYKSFVNYEFIHDLLDCYKYLKIYSVWGHKSLKDIQDQKEIFQFITNFLMQFNGQIGPPPKKKKYPTKTNTETIADCVQTLRNQICKIINKKNPMDLQLIFQCLCNDQLLIPDDDMLNSLKEPSDTCQLPSNLIRVWSEILSMLHKINLLPSLCENLIDIARNEKSDIASYWIEVILCPLTQKCLKKYPIKIQPDENECDGRWNEVINDIILLGDQILIEYLDIFVTLRNPTLSTNQCDEIKTLARLKNESFDENCELTNEWSVKTIDDVNALIVKSSNTGKWKLSSQHDWSSIPLGVCPDQIMNSLISKENQTTTSLKYDNDDIEEIKLVNWHDL